MSMTQADINTFALFALLILILYFVSNVRGRLAKISRRQTVQQFLNTQARLRAVEFAPSAIITVDANGRVVAWNGGAYSMFGYTEQEMIGKTLTNVIPERYRELHSLGIERLRITGYSHRLGNTTELIGLTKTRQEFPIKITLWKWTEGAEVLYTGIVTDITEDKLIQKKADDKLETYRRGELIDESGSWSWDILNDRVITTEGFNRIFDIDPTDQVDSGYLLRRIYHKDIRKVEQIIKEAFDKKTGYTMSYRVVSRDGSLIPVIIHAEAYTNKTGDLINITGTIRKEHNVEYEHIGDNRSDSGQ